ncbi:uncharacterized protein LOC141906061 isoform X2 [Tubulanus polymorphus]
MFFKYYRCRHCRYKCHRKCANGIASQRCRKTSSHSQCSKVLTAGEEHWSKLLQANEVNSNVIVAPHDHRHYCHHGGRRRRTTTSSSRDSLKGSDSNIFSSLYAKFLQWIASRRKDADNVSMCSSSEASSRFEISYEDIGEHCNHVYSRHFAEFDDHDRALSPTDSEYVYCLHMGPSSGSSVYTASVASTSTSYSDCDRADFVNSLTETKQVPDYVFTWQKSNEKYLRINSVYHNGHHSLTNTWSVPPKTKTLPIPRHKRQTQEESLCSTWPPPGYHRECHRNPPDEDVYDVPVFDELSSPVSSPKSTLAETPAENDTPKEIDHKAELRECLGECSIPYQDLKFGDCVRVGRKRAIYKGHWHGEVMIHTYDDLTESETTSFWQEVAKLTMIRHENIALFMGACIDPPHLAVVTSCRRGSSLHEQLHLKREKMSQHTRVNIARQVAQALGYLHAKGVIMGTLKSRNIFLESKVKICLMDYGMTEKRNDRPGFACVPRGSLCYIAPEILSTMTVDHETLMSRQMFTTSTDVFAFGTLLYEVMAAHYPFHGVHPECIIWQICKGKRQSLKHVRCTSTIRNVIRDCWSPQPLDRPNFTAINRDLNMNGALHKRHSSSEPEKLHRIGLVRPNHSSMYR